MVTWIPSQSSSLWQSIAEAGPDQVTERFALLQERLENARSEYALRRYDAVEHILSRLIQTLEHLQYSGRRDLTRYQLLLASALCLEGRLRWRRDDRNGEQRAFSQSVKTFEAHEEAIEIQPSNSRFYTDYGIALYRIGRIKKAVKFLNKACEKGASPPEAFGYLGLAYQKMDQLDIADQVLHKGLKLAPGDKVLLGTLAETQRLTKNYSAAVATYCEAAVAAAFAPGQERDLLEPHQLLDHALALAEEHNLPDQQALSMKMLLRSEGKHAEALRLLDQVLKNNRTHIWARALKGMILQDQGDHTAAIAVLREPDLRLDTPELSWALGILAKALQGEAMEARAKRSETEASHLHADALDALRRARQINPDDVSLLTIEAEILQDTDLPAAISSLQRAVKLAPGASELRNSLAGLLLRSGDVTAASAALEPALAQDPTFVPAMITKAEILEASDQPVEALEWYRKADRADPSSGTAFARLIEALRNRGMREEALSECIERVARLPKDWFPLWKQGSVLLELNLPEEALSALIQARAIRPEEAELHVKIGQAYCRVDRYDDAGRAFDRALQLAENSAPALSAKAAYLYDIAEYTQAAELYEKCLKLWPNVAWYHSALGYVLYYTGGAPDDRLERLLRRGVELDPHFLWSRMALASFLLRGDGAAEAKEILHQGLQDGMSQAIGTDAGLLHLLGWCNYLLAQFDAARYAEALRLLELSVSAGGGGLRQHFDLAMVLLASGRLAAVAEYNAAIKNARSGHRLRRRGLFHIALMDLIEALQAQRIPADGRNRNNAMKICSRLHRELSKVGFNPVALAALEKGIPVGSTSTPVREHSVSA